ncbi:hypothetical protein H5410_048422 [Solanum commersonii]|uniref:Jacalin-type lectin domain-containing protein n=1 Tax=Solanum commersonii TaxID=4109 RepID=A0A9J5XL19_SOLCO|nr:hypothetical protein H5410_048422 [Solanum commersonii]
MDIIKVGPVGRYSGGTIWDEKGRDKVTLLGFMFITTKPNLFAGFHCRSSYYSIISIGIYVKPIISSFTNFRDPRVKDEKV